MLSACVEWLQRWPDKFAPKRCLTNQAHRLKVLCYLLRCTQCAGNWSCVSLKAVHEAQIHIALMITTGAVYTIQGWLMLQLSRCPPPKQWLYHLLLCRVYFQYPHRNYWQCVMCFFSGIQSVTTHRLGGARAEEIVPPPCNTSLTHHSKK